LPARNRASLTCKIGFALAGNYELLTVGDRQIVIDPDSVKSLLSSSLA